MQRSEQINELATALAKAQGQMTAAKRDSSNPFYKSKYADLASVVDAIKKPLSDNGLSYVQVLGSDADAHYIETTLMHSSGQWLSDRVRIVVSKPNDPQAFGSAVTYFRRYSLQAMVGTPSDDDDGNAATGKPGVHRPDDNVEKDLDEPTRNRMLDLATVVQDHFQADRLAEAFNTWTTESKSLEVEAKVFAWKQLPSKTRSTLKAMQTGAK